MESSGQRDLTGRALMLRSVAPLENNNLRMKSTHEQCGRTGQAGLYKSGHFHSSCCPSIPPQLSSERKPGTKLSGRVRHRVAIAHSLVWEPKILLVDAVLEQAVQQALEEARKGWMERNGQRQMGETNKGLKARRARGTRDRGLHWSTHCHG